MGSSERELFGDIPIFRVVKEVGFIKQSNQFISNKLTINIQMEKYINNFVFKAILFNKLT